MKAIKNKIIYLIVVGIIGISLFITGIVRDGNTVRRFCWRSSNSCINTESDSIRNYIK